MLRQARRDGSEGYPPLPQADMASSMDAIRFQVRNALYTSGGAINFRTFSNRLVDEGTLSDDQFDQHQPEISRLYHEWRTGSQVQHYPRSQYNTLPSHQSLPPLEMLPSITTRSQPAVTGTYTSVARLKDAVVSMDKSWELLDAPTTWLYLPDNMNHVTVPVTMMKSSWSQSYIRAKTLEQNEIEWKGNTVTLRWKGMAIHGDEDQRVQKTLFNVVDEEVASQAGLRFDMLVGREHDLSLQQQARALAADGMSLANSSFTGRNHDLAAQSSGAWPTDAEQRPPPGAPHGSQSQIVIRLQWTERGWQMCDRLQ